MTNNERRRRIAKQLNDIDAKIKILRIQGATWYTPASERADQLFKCWQRLVKLRDKFWNECFGVQK